MAGTHGIGTFQINSKFASGNLVFYEKGVGRTATGDVFTIGTAAVKVGGTAQDVDFQWYGTGSKSFILDLGAATMTLVGLATATDGTITITNATATSSTTTGALIVTGGIATAADVFVGDDLFFASGAVINFAASDVTITHSTSNLTIASTVTHDLSTLKVVATQAGNHNELGMAGYFETNYSGVMTATYTYGFGTWINLATSFDGAAVYGVVAAQDNGIYATTLTESATTDLVYGMRAECITGATVKGLYAFSVNAPAATSATNRAIFYSDNVESVGHSETERTTKAGSLAIAYINGSGRSVVYYVNLFVA